MCTARGARASSATRPSRRDGRDARVVVASNGGPESPPSGLGERLHRIARWQHARRSNAEPRLVGLAIAIVLVVAPMTAYLVAVSGTRPPARNPAAVAPPRL